ncbi:Uncharacterized protein APZ42_024714 [Daphnia magna]|uniref:Uncharacterized protein n=1 Tax=Daphnia magna TaxID=35525 RepID=A0A164TTJ4_9CRUS|nr:Uncharacterized protein APZ42_024714 [Daphnia magna]
MCKRRGSVAAATNKVVKAAGKNNSTTLVPGFIPQISKPVHALSQLIQGAALTFRPGNEMENGLGPSTNNTRRTSSTSLPVSDQRRTFFSEAELNRIVARTKHTTERFNGILIPSDPPSS